MNLAVILRIGEALLELRAALIIPGIVRLTEIVVAVCNNIGIGRWDQSADILLLLGE